MSDIDVRWVQRFANYQKALQQLSKFIEKGDLNELEQQGLIKAFEYTHELAWNTLKDFLIDRGATGIYGSKDATRAAFKLDLIQDGQLWMDMIESRNQSSHTYNEKTADDISEAIVTKYYDEFVKLEEKLNRLEQEG